MTDRNATLPAHTIVNAAPRAGAAHAVMASTPGGRAAVAPVGGAAAEAPAGRLAPRGRADARPASQGDAARFPILNERIVFNHAAVSPIPAAAAEAIGRYGYDAARRVGDPAWFYESGQAIRERACRLIGAASPEEIAVIPNTSTGLAFVARGYDWRPGDVIITSSIEFPANYLVWHDIAQRFGVRLVAVDPNPATCYIELDTLVRTIREAFAEADRNWREGRGRTSAPGGAAGAPAGACAVADPNRPPRKVVALSHVQYSTGHRLDLAKIAEAVHAAGGVFVVDAIQSVGAIPLEVDREGVDFLSADGHKWMLGPEGVGIFYCRQSLIETLQPMVPGWLTVNDCFAVLRGQGYRFDYRSDARRFEPGCWNIAGMVGCAESLREIAEAGIHDVWAAIRELADQVTAGVERLGCKVVSPTDAADRSGIVMVQLPDGMGDVPVHLRVKPGPPAGTGPATVGAAPAVPGSAAKCKLGAEGTDPNVADCIQAHLCKAGIDVAARHGRIRVSPHFYNTSSQVDTFLGAFGDMLKQFKGG